MTIARLRVTTIVGTRPEIIRLSRVIHRLDAVSEHRLIHTGQNHDRQLSAIFFEELGIRDPDYYLGVDKTSLGRTLGELFTKTETVLTSDTPDAVLVLGDTNSVLASLIAKRMGITVFHMEAGNRCFDANVPEEVNRRIIDHYADINLAYTEHARRNLLTEGLHPMRIYVTGSPMREVLEHFDRKIRASDITNRLGLEAGRFFLVSMHREENVDNEKHLRSLLDALHALVGQYDLRVVVSTHPRTRVRLDALGITGDEARVVFLEPFGFFDYNALQLNARCTISDSGTVSEEATILGFPAVIIRQSTERPEALDSGSIVLAGLTKAGLMEAVAAVLQSWDEGERPELPDDYAVRNCSQRVVNLIVGTTRLSPIWDRLSPHAPFWQT